MARERHGKQIARDVPTFVKERLDDLPGEVVAATGEKEPSHSEILGALICSVRDAVELSNLLRAYRQEMRRRADAGEDVRAG